MLRRCLPHEVLQKLVAIDYTREMVILAVVQEGEKDVVAGVGQYVVTAGAHTAEIALAVRDEYQGRGIGTELLSYLIQIAKRRGLLGLTADILGENRPVMSLLEKSGLDFQKQMSDGVYQMKSRFRD